MASDSSVVIPKDRSSSSRRDSVAEALSRGGWLGLLLWLPCEPGWRLGGGGRTGMGKAGGMAESGFKDWEGGTGGWGGLGVSSPARSISVSVVSGEGQERRFEQRLSDGRIQSRVLSLIRKLITLTVTSCRLFTVTVDRLPLDNLLIGVDDPREVVAGLQDVTWWVTGSEVTRDMAETITTGQKTNEIANRQT